MKIIIPTSYGVISWMFPCDEQVALLLAEMFGVNKVLSVLWLCIDSSCLRIVFQGVFHIKQS